ncbi:MAG: AMP-binding protein [Tannerella sp.]|jgi:long-chain acyl-CoA synthetase|nr:AMP-binding protein [Tannerella sp.]
MKKRTTIIDFLNESVDKYADNPFLWEKKDKQFEPVTFAETKQKAHQFAAGLIALGVNTGDKIALLSEGRNAWITGELGILHTGAVNVPLSIKLEESNDLIFRLQHSETTYIVVSGGQLKKIRAITGSLPLIKKIIIFDEQEKYEEKEISLKEILEKGKVFLEQHPEIVIERAAQIKPDDLANIAYTSGTTADPKGVMLTHRNYTANVEQALSLMTIEPKDRTLIILPLDHCFAHVAGFYSFMAFGASVATVQTGRSPMETLKNIPINIKEFKPTILLSVPALAKNFRKNIESSIRAKGEKTEKLFKWAMDMAYKYNKDGYNKGKGLEIFKKPVLALLDMILFKKVREAFGGNLKFFIGGGALLDVDLQRFFYAIGIPMFQGYGLSEATPIISSNSLDSHKLGSSGHLVKWMDLKICDPDGKELPNYEKGEIVIRGENVMAGYYKNEKATTETIVAGWLHTGDMGYMDNDGFLYVVGRFKSLLIASDGEKYSPEGIEEALTDQSKFIEQVVLYNNQSPYTTAIIVPNKEQLKSFVKKQNIDWNSPEGKKSALRKLQAEIDEYKKGGRFAGQFPDRWLPAAVAVVGEPFTEQHGLVNSTMKIVRGKVEKYYENRIKALYEQGAKDICNEQNINIL